MNILKATLAALCLSATSAAAIPVGWSFNHANTSGAINGSFIYDADTNVFSNVGMTVTPAGGSGIAVNNYYPQSVDPTTAIFWSTPTPTIGGVTVSLNTGTTFTNAGGSVSSVISAHFCTSLGGFSGCLNSNVITLGAVSFTSFTPPAAVPLPAAGWLLLSGFAALGWGASRRRKFKGALATA